MCKLESTGFTKVKPSLRTDLGKCRPEAEFMVGGAAKLDDWVRQGKITEVYDEDDDDTYYVFKEILTGQRQDVAKTRHIQQGPREISKDCLFHG